jgi:hypothetical protein
VEKRFCGGFLQECHVRCHGIHAKDMIRSLHLLECCVGDLVTIGCLVMVRSRAGEEACSCTPHTCGLHGSVVTQGGTVHEDGSLRMYGRVQGLGIDGTLWCDVTLRFLGLETMLQISVGYIFLPVQKRNIHIRPSPCHHLARLSVTGLLAVSYSPLRHQQPLSSP